MVSLASFHAPARPVRERAHRQILPTWAFKLVKEFATALVNALFLLAIIGVPLYYLVVMPFFNATVYSLEIAIEFSSTAPASIQMEPGQ
jgi:hypothetical protein